MSKSIQDEFGFSVFVFLTFILTWKITEEMSVDSFIT